MTDYEWINGYIGTPHKTNGRERFDGWDCWGLVCAVWREQRGIELPDFRAPNDATFQQAVAAVGEHHDKSFPHHADQVETPADWDFVFCLRRALALHVGLVINRGVLHSHYPQGTVWEPQSRFNLNHPNRTYWRWRA